MRGEEPSVKDLPRLGLRVLVTVACAVALFILVQTEPWPPDAVMPPDSILAATAWFMIVWAGIAVLLYAAAATILLLRGRRTVETGV